MWVQIPFSSTKCEAISLNFLAPFALSELKNNLDSSEFLSVYFDAPKSKNTKFVPIVVGYYSATDGRLTRVLNVEVVKEEIREILST